MFQIRTCRMDALSIHQFNVRFPSLTCQFTHTWFQQINTSNVHLCLHHLKRPAPKKRCHETPPGSSADLEGSLTFSDSGPRHIIEAVGSLGKFHGWGKHHAKLAASRPWQLKLCHLGLSARREVGIHLYHPTNQYKQWIQEPWDLSTAINNNKYKPMELTIQNTHHFYSGIPCSIFECRQNVLQHLSMKSMAEIWTGWVPHLGRKHGRAHCVFVWERWE